jgi:hypothetical protein
MTEPADRLLSMVFCEQYSRTLVQITKGATLIYEAGGGRELAADQPSVRGSEPGTCPNGPSPATLSRLLSRHRRATTEEHLDLRLRGLSVLVGIDHLENFGMGRLDFLK